MNCDKMINYKTCFKLLRPKLWIASSVSTFIGFIYALNLNFSFLPLYFLVSLLITGPLIGGGAVILNQYFDLEEDKRSQKREKYVLAKGEIKKRYALIYAIILFIVGNLLAFYINFQVFFITLLATLLSILYSVPPLRFKKRPYIDSITNGICYGILPTILGFAIVLPVSLNILIISLPLMFVYTAGHMLLAIPDIENDKKFGLQTTAVVLGYKNTIIGAMSLFLITMITIALYIYAKLLPLIIVFIFPIGIYILKECSIMIKSNKKSIETSYKHLSFEFLSVGIIFLLCLVYNLLI